MKKAPILLILSALTSLPAWAVQNGIDIPFGESKEVFYYSLIQNGNSAFDCTGTLIHPRVIFTAAHCLNSAATQVRYAVNGSSAGGLNPWVVANGRTPREAGLAIPFPATNDFFKGSPDFRERGSNEVTVGNDFGYILLPTAIDTEAQGITLPELFFADTPALRRQLSGAQIEIVGFGANLETVMPEGYIQLSGEGRKRRGHLPRVTNVGNGYLQASGDARNQAALEGDSGGSAFAVFPDGRRAFVGAISGQPGASSTPPITNISLLTTARLCWIQAQTSVVFSQVRCP